jgi:uncharacterized phage protein gp47/JayE
MDLYQSILPSGRGVRFRLLTPKQHDSALLTAAQVCGADASAAQLRVHQMHECIKLMVHSVTKDVLPAAGLSADVPWSKINPAILEMPGDLSYDTLFGAKDAEALTHLFRTYHELSKVEAEAIVGKVQPVSVD